WAVTDRLALTYGLRWEVNPPPSEANGNDALTLTQFDDLANLALAPRGTPLYETRYNNLAPRLGIAYQLPGKPDRETVLRGGFGIFYEVGFGATGDTFGGNFPFTATRDLLGVPFPLDPASVSPPAFSVSPPVRNFVAVDRNFRLPYTYQWNAALEQSFSANDTLSMSYVGAAGRRLLRQELLFFPSPGFLFPIIIRNVATSDYHALQLQFQRRLSRGLQALASYTWAHSIDTASEEVQSTFIPPSLADPRNDRGPSNFDVRHSFNTAVTYEIPGPKGGIGRALFGNWSVDTIMFARSATPVDLVGGVNFVGFLSVLRPDVVPGVPFYLEDPTVAGGRRFNRAAFTPPPPGTQGTLGRNALRGFSAWQMDLAFRRRFNLTERWNLQFRAEFFNPFNHPNFGDPGAQFSGTENILSPRFGQSTTMLGRSLSGFVGAGLNPLHQVGGPRSIQLALKLSF
ncbi:MAG: TonB-dependent receptor, partial [Acidobacteria bacterium]|nr:TonB-dependent receptor [Acidobacteriota bacterium]